MDVAVTEVSVRADASVIRLTVTRSGAAESPASVAYLTRDATALQPSDYLRETGLLQWTSGDTSDRHVDIQLIHDDDPVAELFHFDIYDPIGVALGDQTTTAITILPGSGGEATHLIYALDFNAGEPDALMQGPNRGDPPICPYIWQIRPISGTPTGYAGCPRMPGDGSAAWIESVVVPAPGTKAYGSRLYDTTDSTHNYPLETGNNRSTKYSWQPAAPADGGIAPSYDVCPYATPRIFSTSVYLPTGTKIGTDWMLFFQLKTIYRDSEQSPWLSLQIQNDTDYTRDADGLNRGPQWVISHNNYPGSFDDYLDMTDSPWEYRMRYSGQYPGGDTAFAWLDGEKDWVDGAAGRAALASIAYGMWTHWIIEVQHGAQHTEGGYIRVHKQEGEGAWHQIVEILPQPSHTRGSITWDRGIGYNVLGKNPDSSYFTIGMYCDQTWVVGTGNDITMYQANTRTFDGVESLDNVKRWMHSSTPPTWSIERGPHILGQ